jgi:quercetin dioxygenase-like cupin family protein
MVIVRSQDRAVLTRGPDLPTLQRLVDRANGSSAVTVLVNRFAGNQTVPEHVHDVEEILVVVAGVCDVMVDGQRFAANEGDAVIVPAGATHSIAHTAEGDCAVVAVLGSADVRIGGE